MPCTSPPRERSSSRTSISYTSRKRRRVSIASLEFSKEIPHGLEDIQSASTADRFIASRPKQSLPLNATPRTIRVAKIFDLADTRMLNFSESSASSSSSSLAPPIMLSQLRKSASLLNVVPKKSCLISSSANLSARSTHLLALDGSGMPANIFSFPFSWSSNNVIAVICGMSIYSQNMDTRAISRLCKFSDERARGLPNSIEWGGRGTGKQDTLAVGTTRGVVELWDAAGGSPTRVRLWTDLSSPIMSGMSWHDNLIAVGRGDGKISLFDARAKEEVQRTGRGHKENVLGVKWNQDGHYLASGDENGQVFIWDARACKELSSEDGFKRSGKMKHGGAVKALAWCPWKPNLLATGSVYPDGAIRIWSAAESSCFSGIPQPLHTLSLNTSITSLHWSPQCKELLSTHGSSFSLPSGTSLPIPLVAIRTVMTNSLTVHSYPAYKRLVSVTAHTSPIGHSCLSPDGTMVFTICNREETMKMWKIWGVRELVEKGESEFDKWSIR